MDPRIETLSEKNLAGMSRKMSFTENSTSKLWQEFMPRRKEIKNFIPDNLYSVEIYPPGFYDHFSPDAEFLKWAAVEVAGINSLPDGMESFTIPSGLYAVFIHRGPASLGPKTYGFIFRIWLPGSEFLLDNRPHFALMGERYKRDDPDSEEEIWIPVRLKS